MVVDDAGRPVAPGRRSPRDLPEQKGEDGSEKLTGHPEKLGESTLHKLVGFIIQYGEGMTFLSGKRSGPAPAGPARYGRAGRRRLSFGAPSHWVRYTRELGRDPAAAMRVN